MNALYKIVQAGLVKFSVPVGFAWGVAEATFFFVLPDFFLAPAIIANKKNTVKIALAIIAGTATGSVVMLVLTSLYPDALYDILVRIPFTNADMFARVAELIGSNLAIFLQPFGGVPVKVWLWSAANTGASISIFFILLMLGRLLRVTIVALSALLVERLFGAYIRKRAIMFFVIYAVIFFVSLTFVSMQ